MRLSLLSALACALALVAANRATAQNRVRLLTTSNRPAVRMAQVPAADVAPEPIDIPHDAWYAGEEGATGYVEDGAAVATTEGACEDGVGYGPAGFGGMSPWPGVPACCDPWLGYCNEPRKHNPCLHGKGYYTWYHPTKCGMELLTWGPGISSGKCRQIGMCGGNGNCCESANCISTGSSCNGARACQTSTGAASNSCVGPVEGNHHDEPAPAPRNDLPNRPSNARNNGATPRW